MKCSCGFAILAIAVVIFESDASSSSANSMCVDGQCGNDNTGGVNDDEVTMLQVSSHTAKKKKDDVELQPPGIDGYDKYSGDCPGNDIKVTTEVSAPDCAVACDSDESCAGFSMHGGWGGACITKSKSCDSDKTATSGWTFYSKKPCWGAGNDTAASMPRVEKSTPTNDEGNGNALYLDRHDLNCGADGFISSFKYVRAGGDKMRFDYSCASLPSDLMGTCTVRHTKSNDDGNGNALNLDRHNVKCEASELMTQMKLARQGNHKYRYRYTCCSVKGGLQGCAQTATLANNDGKGDARYLDRHNLVCPEGKAMKRFKMNRQGGSKYRYDYTCCSVSKCGACTPYSEEACKQAATAMGLSLGGGGYDFTGNYKTKGCYTYSSGKYKGSAYYGLGGSDADRKAAVSSPKMRPSGYNCNK